MGQYQYIVLDSYPLGNVAISHARQGDVLTSSQLYQLWITDCEKAGARILVPAIAYYEEVRELELRKAYAQIVRLQSYCFHPKRYLALSTTDLSLAGKLWAQVRQAGQPTADRHALDGDAILAAQVINLGLRTGDYIVATKNAKHFTRFGLPAEAWQNITL